MKRELSRGIGDWEQRLGTAMVKSSPTDLVRASTTGKHADSTRVQPHVDDQHLDDGEVVHDASGELSEPRRKA